MPTAESIRQAMHAQPFEPFDLKLVDGTIYTIKHPDYISVPPFPHARELIVYTEAPNTDGFRTHRIHIGLILELLTPSETGSLPPSPQGNGP
jgi:hypothetical protein